MSGGRLAQVRLQTASHRFFATHCQNIGLNSFSIKDLGQNRRASASIPGPIHGCEKTLGREISAYLTIGKKAT